MNDWQIIDLARKKLVSMYGGWPGLLGMAAVGCGTGLYAGKHRKIWQ